MHTSATTEVMDYSHEEIRGRLLRVGFLALSAPVNMELLDSIAQSGASRQPERNSEIQAAHDRLRHPQGNTCEGSPLRNDLMFLLDVAGI